MLLLWNLLRAAGLWTGGGRDAAKRRLLSRFRARVNGTGYAIGLVAALPTREKPSSLLRTSARALGVRVTARLAIGPRRPAAAAATMTRMETRNGTSEPASSAT